MYRYINKEHIQYQLSNLKQITFEITDACNLKCTYCGYGEFYEDYDKREDKELAIGKAIDLLDYLNRFWSSEQNVSADRNVYIGFYGGEPLLNMPFIKAIIEHIEKLENPNRHFTFAITTNALLLHKYMDYLIEKNFNMLISLDGNAENTAYRVDKSDKPAFDRIIKNVELLREKHPEYFERKVNFNAVLHNKNSVSEIYSFFKTKYNKIPSIGELNDMGIKPEMKERFMQTYRNTYESLHQAENYKAIEKDMFIKSGTYQSVTTFLHQYSGFVYQDYTDLLFDKTSKQNKPRWITGTCFPFSKKIYVTVNGKLLPCERIGHQFALGEITTEGIKLDFEATAKRYNNYFAKMERQCSRCHNVKACVQCIFNLNDLEGNPICHGFMNEKDFANYVAEQMRFLSEHPEDYYRIMEEVIVE